MLALTWVTSGLVRLFGGRGTHHSTPFVTEDELRLLVEVSEEEGVLEEEEREMIDNVFELSDTAVREVMVPRVDMVTVEADDAHEEATRMVAARRPIARPRLRRHHRQHHRRALRQRSAARLRLGAEAGHGAPPGASGRTSSPNPSGWTTCCARCSSSVSTWPSSSTNTARSPAWSPSKTSSRRSVGDIKDEYDVRGAALRARRRERIHPSTPRSSLDEFNELVERELPEDGYETVGGFVYSQLDKIPTVGDTVRFQDMEFTVLATKGRRVTKIKVVRGLPPVETETERGEEAATSEHEVQAQPASESSPSQSNVQPAQNPM